jgi:hypothetical protein
MLRPLIGLIGITLALAASALAQAPAAPQAQGPAPLWTIAEGLDAPESAYFHAASDSVFVSNISGPILEKNGEGFISRLTPDGTVVALRWVTGLNAPKGLRSVGNTLWVADIDEVVAIDIATGRITARVPVEGAQFLNDLATAPDGTVYVSDSQLARIYAVKDGRSSVFVEGADQVEQPNGLLVDGNRLIVGSMGAGGGRGGRAGAPGGRAGAPAAGDGRGAPPAEGRGARGDAAGRGGGGRGGAQAGGRLFAFDLTTKARTVVTPEPVGGIDGIESDGRGGFLITDVFGSRLVHLPASGEPRTLLTFPAAGADFGFIPDRRVAIVPFLFGNSASAYDLSDALR